MNKISVVILTLLLGGIVFFIILKDGATVNEFYSNKSNTSLGNSKPTLVDKNYYELITIEDILNDSLNNHSYLGKKVRVIGVYHQLDQFQGCAGSCYRGPELRSLNMEMDSRVPVIGVLNMEDRYKLIEVEGEVIDTPYGINPIRGFDYNGPSSTLSLNLTNYTSASNISMWDFLKSETPRFIEQILGCNNFSNFKSSWWVMENNTPYLMTKWETSPQRNPRVYVNLSFDVNGILVKVDDQTNGELCPKEED